MKYVIINITKNTGAMVNSVDDISKYITQATTISPNGATLKSLLSNNDTVINGNVYRVIDIDRHNENLMLINRYIPGIGNDSVDILLKDDDDLIDKSHIMRRLLVLNQQYDKYVSNALLPVQSIIDMYKDRIASLTTKLEKINA